MFCKRMLPLLTALLCLLGMPVAAGAAEVDCDSVYCFRGEDFSDDQTLAGICITGLPDSRAGTLMLGTRVLRPGDILTAGQVAQMTFTPLRTQTDAEAMVEYLPIYPSHVAPCATMTVSIRGKEDKAPVAEDQALETYKNLPLQSNLKVSDPEGQTMTYTVIRQPRRGSVEIADNGIFTYTPKKNKVGVDSFVYTATDPAGKVSREATVTITLLKPADAARYADTEGTSCRFTAEWMRNNGIFQGENLGGNPCFSPEKEVTRGEFVTMLVKALEIPEEPELTLSGYGEEVPGWLKPYLAAAVRSGITAGLPQQTFDASAPITGPEAAVMLCGALNLSGEATEPVSASEDSDIPAWANAACGALRQQGIGLGADNLTREETANILYRAVQLNRTGLGIFE